MLGVVGLWRAVLQRARVDWPVLSAAWLLLLCATTLLSAAALYGDTVALGGIRRSIASAPPTDRSLLVRISADPATAASLDPIVSDALAGSMAGTGGEVRLVARTGSLELPDRPAGDVTDGTVLGSYDGIADHAELVAGSWAAPGRQPLEATLSEGAATALELTVGDELRVEGSLGDELDVTVRISGIWRPRPEDPYWLADPLELDGTELRGAFRAVGPLVIDRADLEATVGTRRLDLQWRGLLAIDGLRADGLDALQANSGSLRSRLGATLPPRTDFTIQVPKLASLILAHDIGLR